MTELSSLMMAILLSAFEVDLFSTLACLQFLAMNRLVKEPFLILES